MEVEEDIRGSRGRTERAALDLNPEDLARYGEVRKAMHRRLMSGRKRWRPGLGKTAQPVELFWHGGQKLRLRGGV